MNRHLPLPFQLEALYLALRMPITFSCLEQLHILMLMSARPQTHQVEAEETDDPNCKERRYVDGTNWGSNFAMKKVQLSAGPATIKRCVSRVLSNTGLERRGQATKALSWGNCACGSTNF